MADSKGELSTADQWARAFKGEFQGCVYEGREGLNAETTPSALTVILKLVIRGVISHHLDCSEYS